MARAKPNLTDWWFTYLTEVQCKRLLDAVGEPLDPDLALDLWRGSRSVRVVEPDAWMVGADPATRRLLRPRSSLQGSRAREGLSRCAGQEAGSRIAQDPGTGMPIALPCRWRPRSSRWSSSWSRSYLS